MNPNSPSTSLKRDRLSIISLAIAKKRREGSLADLIAAQEGGRPNGMLHNNRIDTSCIPKAWLEVGLNAQPLHR